MGTRYRSIVVVSDNRKEVTDRVVEALAGRDNLFCRGGDLIRMSVQSSRSGDRRVLEVMPEASLAEIITETVQFESYGGERREIPKWCATTVRSRGEWDGINLLQSLVEYPVLRKDGTILQTEGYDKKTHLYYRPPASCPPIKIPDMPTEWEVGTARERLLDVVCDFPFAQPVHRAAWLAGLLTFFARPAGYEGPTPFFLVDGNTRGAGKGLLFQCASLIAFGRETAVTTQASDPAEECKFITSAALSGDLVVVIDNIDRPFGSAKFDAALTTTEWSERILGATRKITLPLFTIWWGTGKNVQFHSRCDTARRTLHIRLLSPDENPEHRKGFKHADLGAHILSHRPQLLADCLTLLRNYVVLRERGAAPEVRTWGSFDRWAQLVCGAVVAAGLPDPVGAHEMLTELADTSANYLGDLLAGWQDICVENSTKGCTARQALDWLAEDSEYRDEHPGHALRFLRLRDALAELCPTHGRQLLPDQRQLGYLLRSQRGRVMDGVYLETEGTEDDHKERRGGKVWVVKKQ